MDKRNDDLVKGERNMENTGAGWDADAEKTSAETTSSQIPPTGETDLDDTGDDEDDD